MNVDVTDPSRFIDEDDGPLGHALGPEDTVRLGHGAVWKEITEKRKREAAERLRPRCRSVRVVDRYAQNLSIVRFETSEILLVRAQLAGSNLRKCKRIERQDDVLLALELRQVSVSAIVRLQLEVRRDVADL